MKHKRGLIEKSCCLAPGLLWFYKTLRVYCSTIVLQIVYQLDYMIMEIEMNNWNIFQKCFRYLFVAQWNIFDDSINSIYIITFVRTCTTCTN